LGPQTACTPAVALVFPSPSGRYLGDGSAVFDMVSGGEGYQPLQGLPVEVDGWVDDTHVAVMHVAHGFPDSLVSCDVVARSCRRSPLVPRIDVVSLDATSLSRPIQEDNG